MFCGKVFCFSFKISVMLLSCCFQDLVSSFEPDDREVSLCGFFFSSCLGSMERVKTIVLFAV